MNEALQRFFLDRNELVIQQKREMVEIIVDFETTNNYKIYDRAKQELGTIAEKKGQFSDALVRFFLRSHRPLDVSVFDQAQQVLLKFTRKFFFFFSDLFVHDASGSPLGNVRRRFGIVYKKYDLEDASGKVFASIKSPLWRLWTFPVAGKSQLQTAEISKKWGGALREVFTDADTFLIDFHRGQWTLEQRAVIFAAAISIDFDFFENQQGSSGLLGLGG